MAYAKFSFDNFVAKLFGVLAVVAVLPLPGEARDPLPAVPLEIETADGVLLSGTFYPVRGASRDTPVVVMLADEEESPAVFRPLARRLSDPLEKSERQPISVLAVALRGQGDSTRVRLPSGEVTDLRGTRLKPADATAMIKQDLEAIRRHLVAKNDSGQLNLNRLGYLGIGLGAIVATNGAALDWSVPQLNRSKQGRDVKALVLVSPPWKQLGLGMLAALRQPGVQTQVASLVTYGASDKRAASDAERIVRQLRLARPEPVDSSESDDQPSEPAFPMVVDAPADSRLQGSALLKQSERAGDSQIVDFLHQVLTAPGYEWSQRRLN